MRAAPDIFIGWYICYFIDPAWQQVILGGRQSEFEHRSLIDSIYCYCTVCLHDSVACGQNLSNEREFYQLHTLRLTKLSGG
jgi:hypothetical protein